MLCGQEYLRDGHVADESDCLLQLTGGRDGDVGEAVDVGVSEEEGRECLWRRGESIQSHTLFLSWGRFNFRYTALNTQ